MLAPAVPAPVTIRLRAAAPDRTQLTAQSRVHILASVSGAEVVTAELVGLAAAAPTKVLENSAEELKSLATASLVQRTGGKYTT